MSLRRPPNRAEVGLPADSRIARLLHNGASRMTIVEVKLRAAPPRHRLYWRKAGEQAYRLLGAATAEQSFECAVTCDSPCLFLCVVEWGKSSDPAGGRCLGVMKAELGDPPAIVPLELGDLIPTGTWVRELLRANDAGTCLEAVVAFREGGPVEWRIRYAVCLLDLANRTLTELDDLPGVFF
jgi:hypothetical protein